MCFVIASWNFQEITENCALRQRLRCVKKALRPIYDDSCAAKTTGHSYQARQGA